MLAQDIRFALRSMGKRPGFAAIAVATLALGIGANTAIFSVIQAVLLRPLDYREPGRLTKIVGFDRQAGEPDNLSPADFLDFQAQNDVFERMGAHGWVGFFTVTGSGLEPERIGGVNVTEGFLPTLGVSPALGRLFTPEEDLPGGPRVAILSHGFWQRRYGGDPAIVGRTILLNARPTTVVGVLSQRFRHIEPNPEREAEVFAPYQFDPASASRGAHFIRGVGRLKPGVAVGEAQAQLETLAARLEQLYPEDNTNQSVRVEPLHEAMVAETRTALVLLLGAVGFVLLVACANVANLLLAGGAARRKELALRASLGASRGRLVRQMLTESAVLSAIGALGGLIVGRWAMTFLTALSAAGVPRADELRLDATVLLFTVAAACGTAILFGLAPALQLSRIDVLAALKEGLPGRAAGALRRGARDLLIAVEVALSLVLLVGAGLLVRSFWNLQAVDPGFASERVLTMQAALPTAVYPEGDQIPFYRQLLDRIEALPGVRVAGAVNILPLTDNYDSRGIQIEDRPQPPGENPAPQARSVTPGYFQAMGIPLVRGRLFDDRDTGNPPLVVVVSDSMARQYWPGENAIGKRITFNSGIPEDQQQTVGGPGSREVIGIVGDVKHLALEEGQPTPFFYTPHAQQPSYHTMTLVIRGTGAAATLTSAIRRELASMDPDVPLYQVRTLETVLSTAMTAPRLRTRLLAIFAGLALVLSLVGVYGVVGYVVSQRTHEIGVRVALGARAVDVVRLIVGQGMLPVASGIAIGLLAAIAVTRLLESLLFGVTPADAATFVTAALLLAAAAAAASFVPARRATRIDPTRALRAE